MTPSQIEAVTFAIDAATDAGYRITADTLKDMLRADEVARFEAPATPQYPESGPQVATASFLGVDIVMVNWCDFRGWEIRRRATFRKQTGLNLGWIAGPIIDTDGSEAWEFVSVRPVPEETGTAKRFGEALLILLQGAGLVTK